MRTRDCEYKSFYSLCWLGGRMLSSSIWSLLFCIFVVLLVHYILDVNNVFMQNGQWLLQSPKLQDRKDKDREISTLKAQLKALNDEQNEKSEVLEQNECLKQQLKRLREFIKDSVIKNNLLIT